MFTKWDGSAVSDYIEENNSKYSQEAYVVIRDSFCHAQINRHNVDPDDFATMARLDDEPISVEDLLHAVKVYSHRMFEYEGPRNWLNGHGVNSSADIGQMASDLSKLGYLRLAESDSWEQFENAFDFDEEFGPLDSQS